MDSNVTLTVDLVTYQVTVRRLSSSGVVYTLPNFLGEDGIDSLKRSNSYNEASGYIENNLVDVYPDKILISILD